MRNKTTEVAKRRNAAYKIACELPEWLTYSGANSSYEIYTNKLSFVGSHDLTLYVKSKSAKGVVSSVKNSAFTFKIVMANCTLSEIRGIPSKG